MFNSLFRKSSLLNTRMFVSKSFPGQTFQRKENIQNIERGPIEQTINQVTLLGRVGVDPVKRGTDKNPVVSFSLATHWNFKYESGDFQQKTDWHRIAVFKPGLRDAVMAYLKKGQRVLITGKLTYSSIEEDSNIKTLTSIVADNIVFLQRKED